MKPCYEAIDHAHTLFQPTTVTLMERALIGAMQMRFPTPHPSPDYTPINDAYCHAMKTVHARFRDDIDAITSNTAAVHADNKYLALRGPKSMYSFYRLHDYHSLIYAAMLSSQRQIALEALARPYGIHAHRRRPTHPILPSSPLA